MDLTLSLAPRIALSPSDAIWTMNSHSLRPPKLAFGHADSCRAGNEFWCIFRKLWSRALNFLYQDRDFPDLLNLPSVCNLRFFFLDACFKTQSRIT